MNVLITGAAGFLGQALASALLTHPDISTLTLTDILLPSSPSPPLNRLNASTSPIAPNCVPADLTLPAHITSLFPASLTHIYLLHGLMSGASEQNLDLGLTINIDSMRLILDHLRATNPGVRVVFTCSCAIFARERRGEAVMESTMPLPGSSYGAQKLVTEVLLNDFARRGLIDARILRLPTVIVRPGRPSGAASSFCSAILREPLLGRPSVLPVRADFPIWVTSTRAVVRNLLHAATIPAEAFRGCKWGRIVNLPGVTTTAGEMLEALEAVGGKERRELVREERDEGVERIVYGWAGAFDTRWAEGLGFEGMRSVEGAVREFVEDYGGGKAVG